MVLGDGVALLHGNLGLGLKKKLKRLVFSLALECIVKVVASSTFSLDNL